jgi:hypothetical protein
MENEHGRPSDSSREKRLVAKLREHPELMERMEALLELTESGEGVLRTADEIEDLLVEEMRRIGNLAIRDWAGGAEERVAQEPGRSVPKARLRKKKP